MASFWSPTPNDPVKLTHHAKRACRIFSACLLFFLTVQPVSAGEDTYLAELQERAAVLGVARSRQWHSLIHYRTTTFGVESPVDDIRFFAAGAAGMTDPEAELNATLATFFWPANSESEHMRCRFIARWEFLRTKLSIDESRLPPVSCDAFVEAVADIRAESVTLVFPTAYLNNPASMFGHTFLRVDGEGKDALMANAVNFAAVTPGEDGGFFYAIKGLFGLYPGYYSVQQYYEKVNEYNDMSQRDMWEYRLDLTPAEAERMVRHVWELKDIYTDYYFFDENCSYHLLFLIDAARPELNLSDSFGWWVVPSDTVRVALDRGMVEDVSYRPSPKSRIEHLYSLMSPEARQVFRELIDGRRTPESVADSSLPTPDKQAVLDGAAAFLRYRYAKGDVPEETYRQTYLHILRLRAPLGPTPAGRYTLETPPRPDDGHATSRFRVAGGARGGNGFVELGWRPAYHDLMDDVTGFAPGSAIEFLDTTARVDADTGVWRLEHVDVVDVTSISPRTALFTPKSWRLTGGVKRVRLDESGPRELLARGNASGGFAWGGSGLPMFFILAQGEIEAAGVLEDDFALGGGLRSGVYQQFGRTARFGLDVGTLSFFAGDDHVEVSGRASARLFLSPNSAVRAEYVVDGSLDDTESEFLLGIDIAY